MKKADISRAKGYLKTYIYLFVAFILISLNVIGIIALSDDNNNNILYLPVFFLLVSLEVLGKGIIGIRNIKLFRSYNAILSQSNGMSLEELAKIRESNILQVTKDLQSIIDGGFLYNAYLDREQMRIVLLGREDKDVYELWENEPSNEDDTKPPKRIEYVKCICEACGGELTVIKGQTGECTYCGTIVKAQ